MDALRDSVEKAGYALQMMRLARWMSGHLADDYEARVVGRMVLVFGPIYVECAFRLLKRPGGLREVDRQEMRKAVREMRDDFDAFYGQIRNDLSAHRDVLELDLAIEAWNEIDTDTLLWFTESATENLTEIASRHSMLRGTPIDFDVVGNCELAGELAVPLSGDGALRFSTDALALTRGHSGFIPLHPVQDAAAVLMSVRASLDACSRIIGLVGRRISAHLLLKTMFINDTMNLLDNLYGPLVGASDKRSPSMLKVMEEGDFGGAGTLAASLDALDIDAVRSVREVRNRACAHLDPNVPLRSLQDMVLDLKDEVLLDRVLNPSWEALEKACAADFSTRWLLMDEMSLSGLRPVATPGVRAFDRESKASSEPA